MSSQRQGWVGGGFQNLTEFSKQELLTQRIMASALGYKDVNDHDSLRHDPLLALLIARTMCWCVENKVDYFFGLAKNARLKRALGKELEEAKQLFEATGEPARELYEQRHCGRAGAGF